ncbi:MAG: hypothetical protein ACJAWS_001392 [Oleiphilaceae bacterium]|jgi:hypothetical protein
MSRYNSSNSTLGTSPHIIEMRLSFLIRRYLHAQTKKLAHAIVQQLELLLKHPDCIGFPNDRCGYKKMLIQWRLLAN